MTEGKRKGKGGRILRRVMAGFALVLVLLGVLVIAVLHSETAFRETLRIVTPMIPGELEYRELNGTLAGRIEALDASYEIDGTRVEMARVALDPSVFAALRGRIELGDVELERLMIRLPQGDAEDSDETPTRPRDMLESLRLPVDISARSIRIRQAVVLDGGNNALLEIRTLALALDWTDEALVIDGLDVDGPQLNARGDVSLGLDEARASAIDLRGQWGGAQVPVAGELHGEGTPDLLNLSGRLTAPAEVKLDLTLADLLDVPRWQGRLQFRDVAPADFQDGLPVETWAGEVNFDGRWQDTQARFTVRGAWPPAEGIELDGEARVNASRLEIQRLQATVDSFNARASLQGRLDYQDEFLYSVEGRFDRFNWPGLEEFALRDGQFSAAGDAERVDATLQAAAGERPDARLRMQALFVFDEQRFRARVDGEQLALEYQETPLAIARMTAQVEGNTESYRGQAQLRGRYADLPMVEVHANATGDAEHIVTDIESLYWLGGHATGEVRVDWRDAVAIDAGIDGRDFDVGQLQDELEATLGGQLRARVDLAGEQPDVQLQIASLDGVLDGRELYGRGNLRWADGRVTTTGLTISAGDAELKLRDAPGEAFDFEIDAPSLATLHPDLAGAVSATGRIGANLERPDFRIQAEGRGLAWQEMGVGALTIDATLRDGGESDSMLQLDATEASIGALTAGRLEVDLRGHLAGHRLALDITNMAQAGETGDVAIALEGGWNGERWRGRATRIQATHEELGEWSLDTTEQPVMTIAMDGQMDVPEHCLLGPSGHACVGPFELQDDQWHASAALRQLPLGLFAAWLPLGPDYRGEFNADLDVRGDAAGLRGAAALRLSPGGILQGTHEDAATLLGWTGGEAQVEFSGREILGELNIPLEEGGTISGDGRLEIPTEGSPHIDARLVAETDNLGLLPTLIPELSRLRGRFEANLHVEGALDSPRVRGEAQLRDGSARILALGTDWTNVTVTLLGEGRQVSLTGHAESGDGYVDFNLDGRDIGEAFSARATVTGSDFKAVHTPEADVDISPNLRIELNDNRLRVGGEVLVPFALITPRDLSTATQPSADQVIVDVDERAREQGLQVEARVTTRLGENVRVEAFGLDARLEGQLTVNQQPQSPTTGNGRLTVAEGEYRAYGQDLTLRRGEIIYNGQQLGNPGLDISAVRQPNPDITVGVNVRGPLRQPRLSVFSDPEMAETEALSYLLFGRSLNEATSAEGREVSNAAIALGLGGQRLLGRLGERIGVEELRVEDIGEEDQASLVLGKYLSPDLYISYGIGLYDAVNTFRVRYRLSSKWTLEATSGLKSSADFVYTIERD